jgi:aminopeptidase N
VALSFNYQEKTAEGRAWLQVRPYCCTQDSLVLDAKSMLIDTVLWIENNHSSTVPFVYGHDRLSIRKRSVYPAAIRPGPGTKPQPAQVYIHYTAMPYADSNSGGSAAISEARGLYFINTDNAIPGKPVQIWTQGETESNSHWMPTIDKPNERFTVRLDLTVPDTFQTLSNGFLLETKNAPRGLRTDTWVMREEIQAYAVMFAIGRYSIVKDKWRDKEVAYYVEPEYAPYARLMFRHTPEMIEYFSTITGVDFPWNKYSQIVARDYVSGAMENTTASLFGEFMNQNAREVADNNYEDVVSHELFHQWFGDYVTAESWSNLTLSESFANYGEQLWRRYRYGAASADELAREDLQKYLRSTENGQDPELVRYYYRDKEDMFDRISYNKGGAILGYLHGLIGDTLFYQSMNRYLTANALRSAEASQWRHAIEGATGKDWNWFFNQWYYRGGHPELDIRYDYNDAAQQLKVTVRQQPSPDTTRLYRLPLKAGIAYGTGVQVIDWLVKSRMETFTYPYKDGVRPVFIPDYTHWLPGSITEHKDPAQWLAQYNAVSDYRNKRKAIAACYGKLPAATATTVFNKALNDTTEGIRRYALGLLAALENEQNVFTSHVQYLAVQDASRKVRAAAFNVLSSWKISAARNDMEKAIGDSSYLVAGAALEGLAALDQEAAYIKAKTILPAHPKSTLEEAVWSTIAAQGAAADLYVFENKADQVYGLRRVSLASHLASYLAHVKDEQVFSNGLALLAKLYNDEHIPNYRQAIYDAALSSSETYRTAYSRASSATGKALIRKHAAAVQSAIRPWIRNQKEQALQEDFLDKAFRL